MSTKSIEFKEQIGKLQSTTALRSDLIFMKMIIEFRSAKKKKKKKQKKLKINTKSNVPESISVALTVTTSFPIWIFS